MTISIEVGFVFIRLEIAMAEICIHGLDSTGVHGVKHWIAMLRTYLADGGRYFDEARSLDSPRRDEADGRIRVFRSKPCA